MTDQTGLNFNQFFFFFFGINLKLIIPRQKRFLMIAFPTIILVILLLRLQKSLFFLHKTKFAINLATTTSDQLQQKTPLTLDTYYNFGINTIKAQLLKVNWFLDAFFIDSGKIIQDLTKRRHIPELISSSFIIFFKY